MKAGVADNNCGLPIHRMGVSGEKTNLHFSELMTIFLEELHFATAVTNSLW